jgi:hypothetical protein
MLKLVTNTEKVRSALLDYVFNGFVKKTEKGLKQAFIQQNTKPLVLSKKKFYFVESN